MKKEIPLAITLIVGTLALVVFYIPAAWASDLEDVLTRYARILAAFAFILGGINLVQVNYPKIRRRETDWQLKVVMLVAAFVMLVVGIIPYDKLMGETAPGTVIESKTPNASVPRDKSLIRIKGGDRTTKVVVDGSFPELAVDKKGEDFSVLVEPGEHSVKVFKGIDGYTRYDGKIVTKAGHSTMVGVDLTVMWSSQGRVFVWLYNYVFYPCNATMFALLAFFIASAAFRAFRARNVEAGLLLGSAILVMLGSVPIGRAISDSLPFLSEWLVQIPNNAGRRAIFMGAALGAVATGLRVILGLERSHLGSGEG